MSQVEVNSIAPAVSSASAAVNAPAVVVWDVLTDFHSWPTWNKSVSRIELKGDVAVGTTFVWVANGTKIVSRLEELVHPRRIAWSGRTLGIRAIHVWEFEERDDVTLVRTSESFEGFIVKLFRGTMKRMLSQTLEQSVTALKAEAEARHSAARA